MDLNRRQILCGLGGIACGAACAGLINPKEDATLPLKKCSASSRQAVTSDGSPTSLT